MKTTKLMIAAAAMAVISLSGCADDEPLSVNTHTTQGDAISFRPAIGSRASEVTNANLQSFYVTSFLGTEPYFQNIAYTKGADGFYNSAVPYYWPVDNTPLDFYAFSPSLSEIFPDNIGSEDDDYFDDSDDGGLVMTATEKQLQNFRVADSIKDQVDLITSYGQGTKKANETAGLELTFGHRLSQIELQAKSENKQYTFKVIGMRIGRAQIKGTFDFTTSQWTIDLWHETAVFESRCDTVTLAATPVSIMGDAGNAMLIPQTLTPWNHSGDPDNAARGAYLSVLVQITATDTGTRFFPSATDTKRTYGWASIPISGTWEAGKKYVYILDFTNGAGYDDPDDPNPGKPIFGDPIKFTVNVEKWTDADTPTPMPVK